MACSSTCISCGTRPAHLMNCSSFTFHQSFRLIHLNQNTHVTLHSTNSHTLLTSGVLQTRLAPSMWLEWKSVHHLWHCRDTPPHYTHRAHACTQPHYTHVHVHAHTPPGHDVEAINWTAQFPVEGAHNVEIAHYQNHGCGQCTKHFYHFVKIQKCFSNCQQILLGHC